MSNYKETCNNYKEYIAGGVSGIVRIIFGYPIETVKVRMQTTGLNKYGIFNLKSLYKGSTGVFACSTIATSIEFGAYNWCKILLDKENLNQRTMIKNSLIAGAFAGICQLPITVPMELIRNRLQTVSNTANLGRFNSLALYCNILKSNGLKGLYKGTMITASRDSIGTSLYFTSYELSKQYMSVYYNLTDTYLSQSVSGVIAGLAFWLPIYPIDVIKNNIQIDDLTNPKFKNSLECAKHIYKIDGIGGFYRGFLPCMIRSVPVHIGIFASYKLVMDRISSNH